MATTLTSNGQFPAPNSDLPISQRPAVKVGRKGKRKGGKNRGSPAGTLSAADLLQLFQAMPTPNRGYRNPSASKPHVMGQGMAWLDEQNTPEKVAARQNRANSEAATRRASADVSGAAAVDFVKQTKGYTDASGKFVPPTIPIEPSSKYGTGSIKHFKPGEARPMAAITDPLTGKRVPMRSFLDDLNGVQATKYGPGLDENGNPLPGPSAAQAGQDYFNPKGAGFNAPKPQVNAQAGGQKRSMGKPAPGASATMDEFDMLFANAPTAPPAQTVQSRLPLFKSAGMAPSQPAFMGPPLPPMGPNDGPNLPFSSPEQLSALRTLDARGFPARSAGEPPKAPSRLRMGLSNYFPGNDYDYLQQLFPGMPLDQILRLVEDPAYGSQFNR